jgi:hypothetical protein
MSGFGKRTVAPGPQTQSQGTQPPGPPASENSGHASVLRLLAAEENTKPLQRQQLAGKLLFDLVCQMVRNERGVRVEDLIAVLASTGGFSCIVAALDNVNSGAAPASGIMAVQSKTGQQYYFGDLPNRYLIESEFSLLSLALGAAQAAGASVSMEQVHDTMRHVAASLGTPQFGVPRLPAENMPGDQPLSFVKHLWPKVVGGLDLYQVPPAQRPCAIGFALQAAIEAAKNAINPALAARIAMECAVPMAKLDPAAVAAGR